MSEERDYLLHRAKKAVVARDFSLAERLYKGFLRKNPHDVPILSELGSVYVRSGKDAEALDVYQKIIEKDGGNFNALNSLAGIYRRLKRYDESIAVLETALLLEKMIMLFTIIWVIPISSWETTKREQNVFNELLMKIPMMFWPIITWEVFRLLVVSMQKL